MTINATNVGDADNVVIANVPPEPAKPAAPAGWGALPPGWGAPAAAIVPQVVAPPLTPRVAGPAQPLPGWGAPLPRPQPDPPPPPAGFGGGKIVPAYELAQRYRSQAAACDFDESERATRLIAAAIALEKGDALFAVDRELE